MIPATTIRHPINTALIASVRNTTADTHAARPLETVSVVHIIIIADTPAPRLLPYLGVAATVAFDKSDRPLVRPTTVTALGAL